MGLLTSSFLQSCLGWAVHWRSSREPNWPSGWNEAPLKVNAVPLKARNPSRLHLILLCEVFAQHHMYYLGSQWTELGSILWQARYALGLERHLLQWLSEGSKSPKLLVDKCPSFPYTQTQRASCSFWLSSQEAACEGATPYLIWDTWHPLDALYSGELNPLSRTIREQKIILSCPWQLAEVAKCTTTVNGVCMLGF